MTDENVRGIFAAAALICSFGVLLNLALLKKRGTSAAILAAAFGALGATCLVVSRHGDPWLIWIGGIAVAGLLTWDFIGRAQNQGGRS